MDDHLPPRNPVAAERRRITAERKLGNRRQCVHCGERRAAALIPKSDPRICARCKRKREGKRTTDKHHPAGGTNDPLTVEIPVNDHRAVLSDAQQDWPIDTLQNPDGDPLRRAAACIRGFVDTAVYLLKGLLSWIPEFLEHLAALLEQRLGAGWWIGTPLAAFAQNQERRR